MRERVCVCVTHLYFFDLAIEAISALEQKKRVGGVTLRAAGENTSSSELSGVFAPSSRANTGLLSCNNPRAAHSVCVCV